MPNAILFYRISRWLYTHRIPVFPKLIQLLIFLIYNSKITADSKIGKGTYMVCKGISTVLIPGTEIGENCALGLRFSTVRIFPYKNVPKIGNNVWIGPNVVIAGPVEIADNVIVIANSYVTNSVPEGAIISGNPAKIIGWRKNLPYEISDNPKFKEGIMPMLVENQKVATNVINPDSSLEAQVLEIFSRCLDLPKESLKTSDTIEDKAEWDSLSNLSIIDAIERNYNFKIPAEKLFTLTSIKSFIDLVAENKADNQNNTDFEKVFNQDFNTDYAAHSPLILKLHENCMKTPSKIALVDKDNEISYAELFTHIRQASTYLISLGINAGDTIILSGEKDAKFVYLYFAAQLLAITTTIVDPKSKNDKIAFVESKVNPKYCFGFKTDKTPSVSLCDIALNALSLYIPQEISSTPESISEIMFTTGTTGNPKGVCLSFKNIFSSASNINSFIKNSSDDVEIIGLPICHSFGLGRLRCNLINGATTVLINGFSNIRLFFDLIQKYNVTGFGVVPAAWSYIKKLSGSSIGKFSEQIKYIEIGSASMPLEEKQQLLKLFPNTRICMHYGSTEASRSCFMEFHDSNHLLSIGKPVCDKVDIAIMNDSGELCPVNQTGEICIKGNMVMKHYLETNDNSSSFHGSFFRTGDIGMMDKDGYFYLVGREKEVINVGGKKVSPGEVEDQICALGVGDCVCIPIKDNDGILGEVVKCYILKGSTNLTFEQIDSLLKEKIEPYKRPVVYDWIDEIPKTESGKKQRLHLS